MTPSCCGSAVHEFVAELRKYVEENPPNYGGDAHSILEMLFTYYHECNNTDTDGAMSLREMARVVNAVCIHCREYEKSGFWEGVKVGI